MLPLGVKISELMKHAGAATGPVLSVMNFAQSAELFQGLELPWYVHCFPTMLVSTQRRLLNPYH